LSDEANEIVIEKCVILFSSAFSSASNFQTYGFYEMLVYIIDSKLCSI